MAARHFLRLLTLLALLFAPVGMIGSHAAMAAAPVDGSGGHCAETGTAGHEAPADKMPVENIDCTIACACLTGRGALLPDPATLVQAPEPPQLGLRRTGLNHAAEPPPPRLA